MARWASLIVLVIILALTSWVHTSLQKETAALSVKDRGEPDAIMWNFKRTDMDLDGLPKAKLEADLMKHYPIDDSVDLEQPAMEIYNEEGVMPWKITADRGWLSGDGEKLLLYGDVYIWRDQAGAAAEAAKEIELITTDLKILIDEEYAETDNFVMILTPSSKVTAVGLQANLQKRQLKLLNQVRGRYDNTPN